jgi:hypothetical protein
MLLIGHKLGPSDAEDLTYTSIKHLQLRGDGDGNFLLFRSVQQNKFQITVENKKIDMFLDNVEELTMFMFLAATSLSVPQSAVMMLNSY